MPAEYFWPNNEGTDDLRNGGSTTRMEPNLPRGTTREVPAQGDPQRDPNADTTKQRTTTRPTTPHPRPTHVTVHHLFRDGPLVPAITTQPS